MLTFFAALVQYIQFWFPSRVPSVSDIAFNVSGLLMAFAIAKIARRTLLMGRDDRGRSESKIESNAVIALFFVILWVVYRWFPLVPTLDFQNIKDGLKPLLLDRQWSIVAIVHDAVAWLVWFRLWRYCPLNVFPLAVSVICAAGILAMEPLFYGNTLSVSNVIGLLTAILVAPYFYRQGRTALTAIIWLIGAMIVSWEIYPIDLSQFPRDFSWLPFSGFLSGSMTVAVASLVEKTYFYGAWNYLMLRRGIHPMICAAISTSVLFIVEYAQKWSVNRSPEITDAALAFILVVALASTLAKPKNRRDTLHSSYPEKK